MLITAITIAYIEIATPTPSQYQIATNKTINGSTTKNKPK